MINTVNYSIEDGEKGILLSFPAPPNLPQKDIYIVDFKVSTTLPKISPPVIKFLPENPSYTISKNKNFRPTVNLTIKANHNFETQTVIQANIRDVSNSIIYTDYLLVICSPSTSFSFEGSILNGNTLEGVSNNHSVLRLSNRSNFNSLFVGMKVTGPGIPETVTATIKNFIASSESADIELSVNLGIEEQVDGNYTFTAATFCASPAQLDRRQYENNYIILDETNNWTLSSNNKTIVKFIPNNLGINNKIKILLPIKNFELLFANQPNNIPSVAEITLGGRVINDTICLASIP